MSNTNDYLMQCEEQGLNPETGTKYSRDELDKAFTAAVRRTAINLGEDPAERHWKDAILANVEVEEIDVTREAIVFFTATVPTTTKDLQGRITLAAAGYRAGPAGDH